MKFPVWSLPSRVIDGCLGIKYPSSIKLYPFKRLFLEEDGLKYGLHVEKLRNCLQRRLNPVGVQEITLASRQGPTAWSPNLSA
jgi:hypothetical protein